MTVVADIANAIRDGKLDAATRLHGTARIRSTADRRAGRRGGAEGERAHGRPARQRARHQPALAPPHGSAAVIAVLLALAGGFVISWSFILPVREAHGFLDEVAAGRFGGSITVPNRDEFGVLAEQMNHMSAELARFDEEQRHAARELGALNASSRRRARRSPSSSPT